MKEEPNLDVIYHTFYERLLSLQYWATVEINHKPTKGRLREGFIKKLVNERLPNCNIHHGILTDGSWQSTESDFIKTVNNSIRHDYGVTISNCVLFMEIKSCAKRSELNKLEEISKQLKTKNAHLVTGIFCYTTEAQEKTILKNFGFYYDPTLLAYDVYNREIDQFPMIDFCFCLNSNEEDPFNPSPYFINLDGNKRTLYRGFEGESIAKLFDRLRYEGEQQ